MSSSKNRFSIGLAFGVSLGLAISTGVVNAGSISQIYDTSTPVDTTMMNNVKTAVNDNNTRVTALETGTPPCPTNMTRVGATCIDQAEVGNSTTWAQAIDTCRVAGKRLPTPGEFYAAFSSAAFTLVNGNSEWVDAVVTAGNDNTGNGGNGTFGVGRMGPDIGAGGGTSGNGILGFIAIDTATDAVGTTVGFRCAR